eukprot:Nitzschia sp. Nitz4//scaffold113_size70149//60961//64974//NITZ4_005963-RA/size70149-augustus-gene-0.97-mRNA-1//-1//CDS//3329533380//287//frame0
MSGMSAADKDICRQVVAALSSDKYKDKNQLFLYPFDLSQTPGYLDVVTKVMDLSTLSANLEAGMYHSRDEFFADCNTIFENAIAYHSTRETKWIAKQGKEMRKFALRERKLAEKREGDEDVSTLTVGSSTKTKAGGKLLPTKKNKKALADKKETSTGKLVLKLGGSSSSPPKQLVETPSSVTSKPKVSIKLSTSTSAEPDPAPSSENKKPRLTLKLGKSKSTGDDASETPSVKASTPKPSTKVAGAGGSRGKELPKGVSPPSQTEVKKATKKATAKTAKATVTKSAAGTTKVKASTSKTAKAKTKVTLKPPSAASQVPPASNRGMMIMTPPRKAQCSKALSAVRRRLLKIAHWFLYPVSDKAILQDYRAKIPTPMDLTTMQGKLIDKNEYTTIADFVLDLRRIVSNCLRYNTSMQNSLRPVAVEFLQKAEKLLTVFLAKPESPTQVYPPLLYCWKQCVNLLDALYNIKNPDDGQMTAYYFLYPVTLYCQGQYPPDYLQQCPKPMDYGTITANLIEGRYSAVSEFEADCKLVLENCQTYYSNQPDGKIFTEQASRLMVVLKEQLESLHRYVKSPAGLAAQRQAQTAVATAHLPKPPIPLLLGILEDLRALKYHDKMTKIAEPAMGPFEKPVALAAFPDYTQHVQTPMDLQTVERKIRGASYGTPEDFEYDILLMFQNCVTYNSARKSDHLVSMAKYGLKNFRKIFTAKMRPFDDPSAAPPPSSSAVPTPTSSGGEIRKEPPSDAPQPPTKKKKVEAPRPKTVTPRITLSAPTATAAPAPKTTTPKTSVPKSKPNQPVPLHIAIAQVKEQFPLRRAVKSLESWEAACARFFKEMMRHSWISAARPKFIFHVPVPVLFPELREAYAAKIKKPMDLTSIECALLAGNKYTGPEEFVSDLALVFSNAIVFNKDGRDIGDPLSCAYYDASIHLLRYCRWLSLELLSEYVEESEHMDEPEVEGLPLLSWKLTSRNRKKAREEMEAIVLKEPIERSLEGDRYTWTEAECEKLLKALRHQSDLRYMTFFIQPNYPADYTAFISRPMDWERVQKSLKKRQYNKFEDIINDLRLIFTNALKYNARHKGTDTVSGRAYDAAEYMSAKLETAVNKMMLTVSDRVERERIDHNNAEREIEAAERAEEERIRAQWKSDGTNKDSGEAPPSARLETSQRIRTAKRNNLRKEQADFEIPFFDDEDDGQHERSYFDVIRQQKAIFESQRQERARMLQSTAGLGSALYMRMLQREMALKWVTEERKKLKILTPSPTKALPASSEDKTSPVALPPSDVLKQLEDKGRQPFQLKLAKPKPRKKPAASAPVDLG